MRWLVLLLFMPAAGAQLEVVHVWEGSTMAAGAPVEAFDAYGVALERLDGRVLWMAMNDNARAYVLDPWAMEVVAELPTIHAGNTTTWWTRTLSAVSVGDVDGDGRADVMVLNTGGQLTRFEHVDGAFEARWTVAAYAPDHTERFWERHPWLTPRSPEEATHLAHAHAWLASVDDEVWAFVHSDDLPGAFAFGPDGAVRWVDDWHDGHAGPWVGNVTADRRLALFATDNGMVVAREPTTGAVVWTWHVPDHVRPGSLSVPPAVADLDADGDVELLVGARQAVAGERWEDQHATYFLLDHEGREVWWTSHPAGNPMLHSRPVPYDVDGDGVLDFVVLDWNTIGRKPGDFERTGPGNLFALSGADGTLLWTTDVEHHSTDHDFPIAAFGGEPSALVPHARNGTGVAAIAVADGEVIAWTPLPEGWTPTRGLVAADLDGDGLLEAVLAVARFADACAPEADVGCREGGIVVLRTDAPATSLVHDGADSHAEGAAVLPPHAASRLAPVAPATPNEATHDVTAATGSASGGLSSLAVAAVLVAWRLAPGPTRRG